MGRRKKSEHIIKSTQKITNISQYLIAQAEVTPFLPAVTCSLGLGADNRRTYTHLTFEQLNRESAEVAQGLLNWGVTPQTKALIMIRPGPDLFVVTFAALKAGIVPVLIDPGMDRKSLKECIAAAEPELFIGIPVAHLARRILGWGKKTIKRTVLVTPKRAGLGAPMWSKSLAQITLRQLYAQDTPEGFIQATDPDSLAAILYTSGSTGLPKGAMYLHRHFVAQVELLKEHYQFRSGAIDVPTFPLFSLFDPALGMSAVFPKMDYAAPAKADPEELFAVIQDFGAEHMFCSPALLKVLARASEEKKIRLPSVKRIISAGAPVSPQAMQQLKSICHADAEIYTPYGATESLPVTSISCSEIISYGVRGQRSGRGVCVGKPSAQVQIRIIKVTDEEIKSWDEADIIHSVVHPQQTLNPDTVRHCVGEIVVYTPSTTQGYIGTVEGNRYSKISGEPPGATLIEGQSWSHRMGDLGYFDAEGYLWLCGRKSHRVDQVDEEGTLVKRWLPLCVEGPLNEVEGVFRSALVQLDGEPVVCIERVYGAQWSDVFENLCKALNESPSGKGIIGFADLPELPVDTRHNAKIKRELLNEWISGVFIHKVLDDV